MAGQQWHALVDLAGELVAPKLEQKYGYIAVRDAEIVGMVLAAAFATVEANPLKAIAAMLHAQEVEVNEWTGDPNGAYCPLCSEIIGNYVNWPCRFAPKEDE